MSALSNTLYGRNALRRRPVTPACTRIWLLVRYFTALGHRTFFCCAFHRTRNLADGQADLRQKYTTGWVVLAEHATETFRRSLS